MQANSKFSYKNKDKSTNEQQSAKLATMWNKQTLSIIICCAMVFASALPVDVPRYKKLGHTYTQFDNSSGYNESSVQITDRLGVVTSTTPTPQFEYALLGQDPEDQHWYRVSLIPTDSKLGYRAQFSTRKTPPFDSQLAHKHDKTIKELLNFLERSEDHNLLKVYGQLLASEEQKEQELKIKRNAANEFDVDNLKDIKRQLITVDNNMNIKNQLITDDNQTLLLAGELPAIMNSTNQNGSNSSMVKNFVYFIKGLK